MLAYSAGRSKSAFTLIELLVVISIISLLISILLPALSSARESANITLCATNQRGVSQMNMMYTTDNYEYVLPVGDLGQPAYPDMLGPGVNCYWQAPLAKGGYATAKALWNMDCPLLPPQTGTDPYRQYLQSGFIDSFTGSNFAIINWPRYPRNYYLMNSYGSGPQPLGNSFRKLAAFKKPAVVLEHADTEPNWFHGASVRMYWTITAPTSAFALNDGGLAFTTHGGKGNITYLDGHVIRAAPTDIPASHVQIW